MGRGKEREGGREEGRKKERKKTVACAPAPVNRRNGGIQGNEE